MKFYTTMTSTLYSTTKFCFNIFENDKIMLFQPSQPHFLAFQALSSPVVCWWLRKEPVCRWWDDTDLGRVNADAWSDQQCRKSSHCLVDVFLGVKESYSQMIAGRLSAHQSSLSSASAGVYGTFPAWATDVVVGKFKFIEFGIHSRGQFAGTMSISFYTR